MRKKRKMPTNKGSWASVKATLAADPDYPRRKYAKKLLVLFLILFEAASIPLAVSIADAINIEKITAGYIAIMSSLCLAHLLSEAIANKKFKGNK